MFPCGLRGEKKSGTVREKFCSRANSPRRKKNAAQVSGVVILNISLRMLHEKKQSPLGKPFVTALQYVLRETAIGPAFFGSVATVREGLPTGCLGWRFRSDHTKKADFWGKLATCLPIGLRTRCKDVRKWKAFSFTRSYARYCKKL